MRVRVIGGGITSSSFCSRLHDLLPDVDIIVTEMGQKLGGRCSKRQWKKGHQITHGCPAFDVRTKEFQALVDSWVELNVVKAWAPLRLGIIDADSMSSKIVQDGQHVLYQLNTNPIPGSATFQPNLLIQKMNFTSAISTWQFNDETANYDWLVVTSPVVAHKSRWEDNFSTIGHIEPPLYSALKSNQEHKPMLDALSELQSKSITSLLTVLHGKTAELVATRFPFEMAHIENSDVLGKIVCEGMIDGYLPIVTHSTPKFSNSVGNLRGRDSSISRIRKESKASSKQKKRKVEETMRQALSTCLQPFIDNFEFTDNDVSYSQIHTWGAAFPIAHPFFENDLSMVVPSANLVLCGDYFSRNVGRVETAVLSGRDAAEKIAKFSKLKRSAWKKNS